MPEDTKKLVCPYGLDAAADHDQHDACDDCPEELWTACGWAFVPPPGYELVPVSAG